MHVRAFNIFGLTFQIAHARRYVYNIIKQCAFMHVGLKNITLGATASADSALNQGE